jgi:F-type H+-transporting ATPase subunit delta
MASASARRHAQAVFEIALEQDELDTWRRDIEAIAEAMTDTLLAAFLESPKVYFEAKAKVLAQRLEGIGPLATNLALLLVAKKRMDIVEELVSEYGRLVDEHRGIAHAKVATAVSLDPKDRENMSHKLGDALSKEVLLVTQVDPSVIGGLTIRVGDKLIDGSTRSRLEALKRSLVEATDQK